jgi:hypothetical protein
MDITDQIFINKAPKDLTPMVEKFKQFLMENLEMVDDIIVYEMTDDVKAKQSEAGITGHTHLFVCKFQFGQHVLSLNANKITKRGWKKNVEYVNKSYEKFLKDIVKSIK